MIQSSIFGRGAFGQLEFGRLSVSSQVQSEPPPASRTFAVSDCMGGTANAYITPDDTIDYAIDWSYELDSNETITYSTWQATGLSLNAYPPYIQDSGTITTVWLSGGTAGTSVYVKNIITTSYGRIIAGTFNCYVNEYSNI